MKKPDQKKVVRIAFIYLGLVIVGLFRAVAQYFFVVPNRFAPGGFGGISSIIFNIVILFDVPLLHKILDPSVTMFVMNIPFIIACFFILSREFALRTTFCVVVYSGFMAIFRILNVPTFRGEGFESSIVILAALAAGVVTGVCLAFNLMLNSSAGGTDIIAKMVYKKNPAINVQWLIFIFDGIVVLLSGVTGLINMQGSAEEVMRNILAPILYSLITLFLTSKVADILTNGVQASLVFTIISEKYAELGKEINDKMGRGVTVLKGRGFYTKAERNMLICVIKKRQSTELKKLIKDNDPNAFMYVYNASEVNGIGFRTNIEGEVLRFKNKKANMQQPENLVVTEKFEPNAISVNDSNIEKE